MSVNAIEASSLSLPSDAPACSEFIVRWSRLAAHTSGSLSSVLMQYWHERPRRTPAARMASLATVRARVRAGELPRRALAPFALGDDSAAIVASAVDEYVGGGPVSLERRALLLDEAYAWIRRGLALNRAAVFVSLLALPDEALEQRLRGLRLSLDIETVARVQRELRGEPAGAAARFFIDWQELLQQNCG